MAYQMKYKHHYACVVWNDPVTHRGKLDQDEVKKARLFRQVSAGMVVGRTRQFLKLSAIVDIDHKRSDDVLVIPRSSIISVYTHDIEVEDEAT